MKTKWMATALAALLLASGYALAHGGGMMGQMRDAWQSVKSRAKEMVGMRSSSGDMGCPMMGGGGMMAGGGMMGSHGTMGGGVPNEQWRGRDARPLPERGAR